MQSPLLRVLSFVLAAMLLVPAALGRCNTCGQNGAACLDENRFYLCLDGDIQKSQVFSCAEGAVCTESAAVCEAGAVPACSASVAPCGVCDGSKMFACTSCTTFSICNGTTLLPQVAGNCPPGTACDSTQAEICLHENKMPFGPECHNEAQ